MITRFTCWMDGQGLHDLDPCLLITDIAESAADRSFMTVAGPDGLHLNRVIRRSLSVAVTFVIRERSPMRRAALMDKVMAWASGRVLTVGHRPDQQLRCQCTGLPDPGSALKWHAPLTMQFTAFAVPYWEAARPAAAWITPAASQGSTALLTPGTAPAPVDGLIINQSGATVNALTLACGETSFAFTDLGLADGERLLIDHDDECRLQLTILGDASRSVMGKRTGDSHDELICQPGRANAITLAADQPVSVKCTVRGRWL